LDVEFTLGDLSIGGGRSFWVEVLAQEEALRESRVRARVLEKGRIDVETQNVSALLLDPQPWRPQGGWEIEIDGQALQTAETLPLLFQSRAGRWRAVGVESSDGRRLAARRETDRAHGLKSAFLSSFLLVYGASGTDAETEAGRHVARCLARSWAYRGNGDAPIVSDREILGEESDASRDDVAKTVSDFEGGAYRLILIGNEDSNLLLRRAVREGEVRILRDGITIGRGAFQWTRPAARSGEGVEEFTGDVSIAALITDPFEEGRLAAVFGGTSPRAIARATLVQPFSAAAGWPDLLVFDEAFFSDGWAAALAAGLRR